MRSPEGTFTTFDGPQATNGTLAVSINSGVTVAGTYNHADGSGCYLRRPDGALITFGVPGSTSPSAHCHSLNDAGTVAGNYFDGATHGFTPQPRGALSALTTFHVSGSHFTLAAGINDAGIVTGYCANADGWYHGFLRGPGSAFITFDVPGFPYGTIPLSSNSAGEATGFYYDVNRCGHGFLRLADGTFIAFDGPGASNTFPEAINDQGTVTGSSCDANGTHGFVRGLGGVFIKFDVPGALETYPAAINGGGTISGNYGDAESKWRSFLLIP